MKSSLKSVSRKSPKDSEQRDAAGTEKVTLQKTPAHSSRNL